jgi:C-terminal processing protease CtpA/Prc
LQSPAALDGRLKIGDFITKIHGHSIKRVFSVDPKVNDEFWEGDSLELGVTRLVNPFPLTNPAKPFATSLLGSVVKPTSKKVLLDVRGTLVTVSQAAAEGTLFSLW